MPEEVPPLLRDPSQGGLGPGDGRDVNRGEEGHRIDLAPDITAYVTVTAPGSDSGTGGSPLPDPDEAGITTGLTGEVPPASVTYKSNRWSAASSLEVTIAPQQTPVYPDTNVDLEAYILGTMVGAGRLEEAGPDASVKQDEKGGIIPSSGMNDQSKTGDIGITLVAFDELRYLGQNTHTNSYDGAPVSEIVSDVFSSAGVSGDVRLQYDPELTVDYKNQKCRYLLAKLADRVRGVYRVNPRSSGNRIIFTDAPEVERHRIGGILGISEGLQKPPYDGVRVIGGPESGGEGDGPPPEAMSQDPVTAEAGDTSDDDRVYTHRDSTITSEPGARRLADALLDEFVRQQRKGEIKLVGNAPIQPFDTVTTPPSLGGREYAVSTVEHTLSSGSTGGGSIAGGAGGGKGFRTKLKVNGLVGDDRGPLESSPAIGFRRQDERRGR